MFIQVIDFQTDRIDEVKELLGDFRTATEGKRTAKRALMTKSRDDENRYLNLVFFDSYEEAMKNSQLPETGALAEQLMKLSSGPPTFYNLDVVQDESL